MQKEVVSRGVIRKCRFIKEILDLEVRYSPVIEGYELEKYVVTINKEEEHYQFDGETFYLDEVNQEKTVAKLEEDTKKIKKMEDEGKTKEDINKWIKGRGKEFIDRVEYIIVCDGLLEKVKNFTSRL